MSESTTLLARLSVLRVLLAQNYPEHHKTVLDAERALASAPQASRPPQGAACQCAKCYPLNYADPASIRMIVCPVCGDKRCVHASNHEAPCAKTDIYAHNSWVEKALAAPPQGASSLLPGWRLVPVEPTEEMVLAGVAAAHQEPAPSAPKRARNEYRAMLAASPLPTPQEPAMTEAQALVIADKYGQRWKASDEEGISFEKSQFFMFLAALLTAPLYAAPARDSAP